MAYYGLSTPFIAKLDVTTNTYTGGFRCGKAVGTDVTPQWNESKLFGDNELAEDVTEFKHADVKIQTTELPIKASNVMFGHEVNETTNKVTYHADDQANFVGYGFYVTEQVNGVKSYVAAVLPKAKFKDFAEAYTTKGDSIELKTPSIDGTAYKNAKGEWRVKETFTKEEEAVTFLKDYLNITE